MNECMTEWRNEWMNEWKKKRTVEWMNESIHEMRNEWHEWSETDDMEWKKVCYFSSDWVCHNMQLMVD